MYTRTENVHVDIGGHGLAPKEIEGWEMGRRPELLPRVCNDVDEYSDEGLGPLGAVASFY